MNSLKSNISNCINIALENKLFAATSVGIIYKDGSRVSMSRGRFTFDPTSQQVEDSSLFDIASITKVLPTGLLILKAIDDNLITLDDKVIRFIPDLKNNYKNELTIRHLLTYSLNYKDRLSDHKDKTPEEILNIIFSSPLITPPGTISHFANANGIMLGLIAEIIYSDKISALLNAHITQPLTMERTLYRPLEKFNKNDIVPSHRDSWRGRLLQGEVHDETAFTLQSSMDSGSAGVFSTTSDLLNFIELFLHDGQYNGKTILSKSMVNQMLLSQLPHSPKPVGLGWQLNPKHLSDKFSRSTIYKTGHTGCCIIADIERGIGFVFLSNFILDNKPEEHKIDRKKTEKHYEALNNFRSEIIEKTLQAL